MEIKAFAYLNNMKAIIFSALLFLFTSCIVKHEIVYVSVYKDCPEPINQFEPFDIGIEYNDTAFHGLEWKDGSETLLFEQ